MSSEFNPDDHTVDEVTAYLADADETEQARVLDAERAGKARKGITGDEPDAQDGSGPTTTETKGQTFSEAAKDATPDEGDGFLGHSPERERTGRSDKGLSQRNPAIMEGGPVPDPRQGVDDSEALNALSED